MTPSPFVSGHSLSVSHSAPHSLTLQVLVRERMSVVQESVLSLHSEVKPGKRSQVYGLASGSLEHVAMGSMFAQLQSIGALDWQSWSASQH